MKEIMLNLENCYGIRKLCESMKFYDKEGHEKKSIAIYAPNGSMKSSFAKTFDDLSNNETSTDLVYGEERPTLREIKSGDDEYLVPECVFVIKPYIESYSFEKESTLLANERLKQDYEEIIKSIDDAQVKLLKELKKISGIKGAGSDKKVKDEFNLAFEGELFEALYRIKDEVEADDSIEFVAIKYNEIFNADVMKLIRNKDFIQNILNYIESYTDVVSKTKYLRSDFNHYNAKEVQKNLGKNGFFNAKHNVQLFDGDEYREIKSDKELENLIQEDLNFVLADPKVSEAFNNIDKQLSNVKQRSFRDFLKQNPNLITKLIDIEEFRKELWLNYIRICIVEYHDYVAKYGYGKARLSQIVKDAKDEETQWLNALKKFEDRFHPPFKLEVKNQDNVMLKGSPLEIRFIYDDGKDPKEIDQNKLLKVLSQGERRSLYLLNIIFELEERRKQENETLLIIDDIADSFDYKNKYTIIEYLSDLNKDDKFYQIILTHNFDFFRTVVSRFVGREQSFMVKKNENNISFYPSVYIENPFKYFKSKINEDTMIIAMIPFVRNLIEFSNSVETNSFKSLTSLLHQKELTKTITIGELETIYKGVLKTNKPEICFIDKERKVIDVITSVVESILKPSVTCNLERKIVLAIAIRLKTEEFLKTVISDTEFLVKLEEGTNQTNMLIRQYKKEFAMNVNNLEIIDRVSLMTPENIHLNTFMYEPILDLSEDNLIRLYKDCSKLKHD